MQNNLKEKVEIVYLQNTITNEFKLVNPIESKVALFATLDQKPIAVSTSTFRPPSYFI
ncbi:hypothetical protein FLA105534_02006 [Flavobacterium bizetiae]|uniref:Uncharacterized protein n=2 Tax=Flavobacterium bizetiae TaxID=2704140 RepID=A0A6J4GJF0_9FLAO|nr:hypothetical protein FLA105534_02006 [Flavobacterium bizetiae]CAD5342306.1 hypothetical protein FLA105535_02291 [Flavobacterium bizetiae]CAD5348827.1 hypothetical protein FLA105534_02797 [Flavobacterium bizetiae]